MSIIRRLQKAFRNFNKDPKNYAKKDSYLAYIFYIYRSKLEKILLDSTPKCEDRIKKGAYHQYKSYNDEYFSANFSKGPIVPTVKLFIKALMQYDLDTRCKKIFRINCCNGEHNEH